MATSIRKNFIYNLFLNVSAILFPLITAPYVARVLGPNAIGLVGFAMTYVGYYAIISQLGSGIYGQRKIATLRDSNSDIEKFISEMLTLSIINTSILSVVFIASIFLIPKFYANYVIFFIAGFSLFLRPLDTLGWYFKGKERFGFITSRALIIRVISITCLFLFVKSDKDLNIYVALSMLTDFGVIFSNIIYIRKDGLIIRLTKHGILKHYKPLFILFASTIAISIYTMLDKLMLGFMSTYSEVSYYGYATTLNKAFLSIVTSLSGVALPRMAYYFKDKDYTKINDLMGKSLSLVAFLAIPMAIGMICIAPYFVPLFLGTEFTFAIGPTMIMSGVIIAIGFNNLYGVQVMLGLGMDKSFLYCVLFGTVSNFFLNLILIPTLGATGASLASVFAEFLILFIEIYYVKKYTEVRFNGHDVVKALIGALLFIPIAYILHLNLDGWWYIASLIPICVAIYIISQLLMHNQVLGMFSDTILSNIRHK